MYIKRMALYRFRNLSEKIVDFSRSLTIVVGENAKGKTNILEAICCLISGEGFRESKEEELIQIGEESLQLDSLFVHNDNDHQFRIILQRTKNDTTLKTFFVEKAHKTQKQYIAEQTKAVLFAPEQVETITGAPSLRRLYFDHVISSFDYSYKVHINNYEQALRKRNKVLEYYHGGNIEEQLSFWDTYLIKEGACITDTREKYISFLNKNSHLDGREFEIVYEKNEFSLARLKEKKELELKIHKTLIGPQKDDFSLYLLDKKGSKKNIQKYGSRSEQRLGIFWLKMNEIRYMENELKIKPILLLDDVFSEFDHDNKERILNLIEDHQTIMTTTDEEFVEKIGKKNKDIKTIFV